jgi:hypothetical protein
MALSGSLLETQAEILAILLAMLAATFANLELLYACVSRKREIIFSILCNVIISTSIEVCTRHVPFSSVNYCVNYNY